jgi:predicted site-specific integrase-resolvase
MQNKLVTVRKAASDLGIHPNTLRRWSNSGVVAVVRLPNNRHDRRFSVETIEALMQEELAHKYFGGNKS